MPGAGDVRAGGAYVEIGGEDRQFNKVLGRAREKMKRFADNIGRVGRRLVVAGTAMIAPLALSVRKFASYGDQIAKMARRTGFTTEAVSRLGYAAQISGTSIEALEMGLKRMSRTIFDASIGLAESKRTLDILGISLDEIQAKSPEEQFLMMAEAIGRIDDPSKKAALAMTAMGRSGTMLIPLFDLGAEGIARLGKRAEWLGIVLGTDTTKGAEDLTDAVLDMKMAFRGIQLQIGRALLPIIMSWIAKVVNAAVAMARWVGENKKAIVVIAKIATTLLAVGIALITVSGLMKAFLVFFTPGGALMLAVAAVLLLAEAFGATDTGIANMVGSIKIFGKSIHDWMTFAGFALLKFYEKTKFIAVGLVELWKPMVERLKSIWRDMSVFLADTFLWSLEKIIDGIDYLPKIAAKGRAKLLYFLGAISKTQFDIEIAMAERSLLPGTRTWLADTRKGLKVYAEELKQKSKEGIDAADADWNKSRDARAAKLKKDIGILEKAEADMMTEREKEDDARAIAQAARNRAQMQHLDELREAARGVAAPGEPSPGDEPPAIGAARRAIIGTTRGWRALGVAAGVGGQMVDKLTGIEKAAKETAKNTRDMTSRYGGT